MRARFASTVVFLLAAHCGIPQPPLEAPPPPVADVPASATPAPPASPSAAASATRPADSSAAPAAPTVAWAYEGPGGPEHWGDLEPDYATCKTGQHQTPVDLVVAKAEKSAALKALAFHYAPLALSVLNKGSTVQVPSSGDESFAAGDDAWDLVQFHLHAPSEHTVDGKHFDAELHFVHKNAKGELAVVALFVKRGQANKTLKAVLDNAPTEAGAEAKAVPGVTVDPKTLLPARRAYFTYNGSLTIPPCTEGVTWFLLKAPIEMSPAQLAQFHAVTHGDTNRPLQPLGDRTIQTTP